MGKELICMIDNKHKMYKDFLKHRDLSDFAKIIECVIFQIRKYRIQKLTITQNFPVQKASPRICGGRLIKFCIPVIPIKSLLSP